MEKLNSDIVSEISSRLPIKSFLQCRKVCRIWRSLFGKPKTGMLFAKERNNFSCHLGLYYREESPEMVNFNCNGRPQKFYDTVTKIGDLNTSKFSYRLVGSCNGLVCYLSTESRFALQRNNMCVFNPTTDERIYLPKKGGYFDRVAGFGYCHCTNTYKVVWICNPASVHVYTVGDGSGWRDKPKNTYALREGWGVYANGALHWLNRNSNCDIVAFDITDETFRSLPSPPYHIHFSSYKNVNLGTFDGNLYLSLPYKKQGERIMDIWVFKKNTCGRSARLNDINSFKWINVFRRKWHSGSKCQLLSLTESEIVLWQGDFLSCYDLKTAIPKKLWYLECPRLGVEAIPHMNSLVSLKDACQRRVGEVDC